MTLSVRPAAPDDATSIAALSRVVYPYFVRGAASYQRMIASPPPGKDWACFVATEAGAVVGRVSASRSARSADPSFGQVLLLHVHPDHRRRGLGTALFSVAAAHLRSVGVHRASATTTVEALLFARRFGFEPTRELRFSAVDLRPFAAADPTRESPYAALDSRSASFDPTREGHHSALDPRSFSFDLTREGRHSALDPRSVSAAGPALGVVSLRDVDPRALHAADVIAATDEPGDAPPVAASYETWRYDVWDNIGLDRDSSTALLDGAEVVSFSVLMRDGDRVWSDMTATTPSHRGRGLARLVKTAALHRAAASGALTAYTSNDESNAPMLAVNTHLGYQPVATQLSCVADL